MLAKTLSDNELLIVYNTIDIEVKKEIDGENINIQNLYHKKFI